MARQVTWIEEPAMLGSIGQEIELIEPSAPPNGTRRKLSTIEKVAVTGLLLQAIGLGWAIYTWNERRTA